MRLLMIDYAEKINELHNGIGLKLKTTVEDAIKIGGLLTEVKNKVGHGNFGDWIKDNCNFSDETGRKYMLLFTNSNLIGICNNLQEAYDQLKQIETHEKQIKQQRKNDMIKERMKTGIKPEGWDRSIEYEYQKKVKEEKDRDDRIEKLKRDEKERIENSNNNKKEKLYNSNPEELIKEARDISDELKEREKIKDELFRKMRLTGNNSKEPIYDALLEYLMTLDENQRLEACHNIIKFCKTIANELQVNSIKVEGVIDE